MKNKRESYKSDVSDQEWEEIKGFFPEAKRLGRPRKHSDREIYNAICYLLRTGSQWDYLPHDFPPKSSVKNRFYQWVNTGLFEKCNDELLPKVRKLAGRKPEPSAGSLDSQSVRTSFVASENKGWDGNKGVSGRKRHILVDALGLLLMVVVQPANLCDSRGAEAVLSKAKTKWKNLCYIWADSTYQTKRLMAFVQVFLSFTMDIVKSIKYDTNNKELKSCLENPNQEMLFDFEESFDHQFTEKEKKRGFKILRQRYKVERTLAWICKNRRLSKDYEVSPKVEEAFCYLAMTRLMMKRLANGTIVES